MSWVAFAVICAALRGIVAIIDSHLLSKKLPDLWCYLLPIGTIQLIFGLIVLWIYPFPENIDAIPLLVAIGMGVVNSLAVVLMLSTMQKEEVSRIIPVVNTSPIFVALMAVPLLGESLGFAEWLAIFLAVAGAMLISLRWDMGGKKIRLSRSLVPLLFSSLLFASVSIATKYVLNYISYWNLFSISTFCFGAVYIPFSLRPSVLRKLKNIPQFRQSMSLLVFNEVFAAAAIVFSFLAISNGPVSLASTILNTRPAFVFLFALIISHFFPSVLNERLNKGIIISRLIAVVFIVSGIALLTL